MMAHSNHIEVNQNGQRQVRYSLEPLAIPTPDNSVSTPSTGSINDPHNVQRSSLDTPFSGECPTPLGTQWTPSEMPVNGMLHGELDEPGMFTELFFETAADDMDLDLTYQDPNLGVGIFEDQSTLSRYSDAQSTVQHIGYGRAVGNGGAFTQNPDQQYVMLQANVGTEDALLYQPLLYAQESPDVPSSIIPPSYSYGPRHVPLDLSNDDPWSSFSVPMNFLNTPLSANQPLFGPPSENPYVTFGDDSLDPNGSDFSSSTEYRQVESTSSAERHSEGIEKPPPDNPVGPPTNLDEASVHSPEVNSPKTKKKGGRKKGTQLNPQSRHNAGQRRKDGGACWWCRFNKYPCQFDTHEKCKKCKKIEKPTWIWGCDRTTLPDLTEVFLPTFLMDAHQPDRLSDFCNKNISSWRANGFDVFVTWGFGRPYKCTVQEFEPEGQLLRFQHQYRMNTATKKYELFRCPSPPIGIFCIPVEYMRKELDNYLNEFIDQDFQQFPEVCFRDRESTLHEGLLHAAHRYHAADAESSDSGTLLHLCLKLIVVDFIATHAITLSEDTKDEVYRSLEDKPPERFGIHTSSRFLNRELKFLWSTLHTNLLTEILKNISKLLMKSSDRITWAKGFVSLLVLAMTAESIQLTIRNREDIEKQEGSIAQSDESATDAIKRIDDRLGFLQGLFHHGYSKKGFNPIIKDHDRMSLDSHSQQLAKEVRDLIEGNLNFLSCQEPEPPTDPLCSPTSPFIARFLLSFWSPAKE